LSVLLNNHPEVFLDEKAIAIRTLNFRQRVEKGLRELPATGERTIWEREARRDDRLSTFLNWKRLTTSVNLGAFVTNSFSDRAAAQGKVVFGDKSPDAIARLPELLSVFSQAKILHLVRDPRPNVASLVKRQYLPLPIAAQRWKDWNLAGLAAQQWQGEDRIFRLRYEDLLQEPELTLQQVCDFLNLAFHPQMLNLQASAATQAEDAYVKPAIDTAALTKWKTDLRTRDLAQIERICGDLMMKLGYERATTAAGNENLGYFRSYRLQVANAFRLLFRPTLKRMIDRKLVDEPQSLSFRIYQLLATIFGGLLNRELIDSVLRK